MIVCDRCNKPQDVYMRRYLSKVSIAVNSFEWPGNKPLDKEYKFDICTVCISETISDIRTTIRHILGKDNDKHNV